MNPFGKIHQIEHDTKCFQAKASQEKNTTQAMKSKQLQSDMQYKY